MRLDLVFYELLFIVTGRFRGRVAAALAVRLPSIRFIQFLIIDDIYDLFTTLYNDIIPNKLLQTLKFLPNILSLLLTTFHLLHFYISQFFDMFLFDISKQRYKNSKFTYNFLIIKINFDKLCHISIEVYWKIDCSLILLGLDLDDFLGLRLGGGRIAIEGLRGYTQLGWR